jgi:tripartite-type tricarboxylate transporter receptor subunit TctC
MHKPMRPRRRSLIAGAAASALLPRASLGQPDYPNRLIRMIVPYPPGGGVDVTARVAGAAMARFLGQNIVVEHKPGAGGSIGSGAVATAAPDGYTLLMHSSAHIANQHLMANLPFHHATAFIPVSQVIRLPQVLVVPSGSPAKTVRDLVALAKEKPGSSPTRRRGAGRRGTSPASSSARRPASTRCTCPIAAARR